MAGNLVGSVFGFVRQSTIAGVFGESVKTDAFFAASIVPQMFYDLVIGAAVSAALIPVFTEISERRGRGALWPVVGTVLGLVWGVLAIVIALLIFLAEPLMHLLLFTYHVHLRSGAPAVAVPIVRVLVLSLFFLGTSAVLTATLFSLRRFRVPAFAPSLYHLGIIAGAFLLKPALGIMALPVGAVAGAGSQSVVEALALLRERPRQIVHVALSPEVRQILRLYAPIAAGLLVSIVGQVIDIIYKARLGMGPLTAMGFATTLVQFPIGIAVAAMSFAVLPSISSDAAFDRMDRFKDTLAMGMRLVLFLTIPAAAGLIALAGPIVSLVYMHGALTTQEASRITAALIGYALQIPFVGVDQMLIFAFYARKDTLTPMLVGVVGVLIYVTSAWPLSSGFGIFGLALANSLQNSLHAIILLALLLTSVGALSGRGIPRSLFRSVAAALLMGGGAAALAALIHPHVSTTHLSGQAELALVPLGLAVVLYFGAAALLRSPELAYARDLARRRRPF
jgi:putative peptidoglycan lipid II flippase